jgi:opacity protein-like surface antigen
MKKLTMYVACALLFTSFAVAQDLEPVKGIRIGPTADFNLALNISQYNVGNTKNNARPGSAFGVMADIPVAEASSIRASLQYLTMVFNDENTKIDNSNQNLGWMMITRGSFSYLSLRTLYQYRSVLVGFQAGVPVRAHVENCHAEPPVVPTTTLVTSASDASWLLSAMAGTDFKVMNVGAGEVRAILLAEYPFNQTLKSSVNTRPQLNDNFRMPSISLSFAWLFAL